MGFPTKESIFWAREGTFDVREWDLGKARKGFGLGE